MGRVRARARSVAPVVAGSALTVALFATSGLRGQTPVTPFVIVEGVGLPAVDEGVIHTTPQVPGGSVQLRRAAIQAALVRASGGSSRYTSGRVLVRFADGTSDGARQAAVSAVSRTAAIAPRPGYADFDVVRLDPSEDPESVARAFSERPEVLYAQAAYRVHTLSTPNDPLYASLQWNLPLINIEAAWDLQPQAGSTVTVAVLDTGLAYEDATITATIPSFTDDAGTVYPALGEVTIPYSAAPQLVGAGNAGRIVAPYDFIWNTTTPLDFDGHGTHVSGTIGQLTNDGVGTAGIAPNVKLMPLKVVQSTWDALLGSPNDGDDGDLARAIRYATDNGAKIINMSVGRTGPPAPAVEAAMRYAVGKGVFLAVAAGNDFEGGNATEVVAEICSRLPGAVSVAAVDPSKARAYYSNTGSYIELAAPGGSARGFGDEGYVWQQTFDNTFTDTYLLPTTPYRAPRFDVLAYAGYTGTSMAAAHVSGVAAMLIQQGLADPAAIEDRLEQTAVDLGATGRDETFGFGLLDARAALRGVGAAK
jgi:serine protease